jgi:hypothetical protein
MRNFLRFGFVLLFFGFGGFDGLGQSSPPKECGTREPTKEEMIEILRQEKAFKQSLGNTNNLVGAITVYIKFHSVLNSDGTGRDISSSISTILYYLNQKYASVNITFAQSGGIDYIYSNGYYDFYYGCSGIYDENVVRNGRDVTNAINIYFVGTIKGSDCTPSINGFVSDFPALDNPKSTNAIFIRTVGSDWSSVIIQETIPHEMGHYFNLFHTHQSGGDSVSDTPYDPADKSCVSNCVWNCTYYNPDVRNLMSYYHGCRIRFTAGQYQRMEDYGKTYRTNLNTNLAQRYYLDGLRRILISPTTSNRLLCGGNTISFDYGMYGESNFVNATSTARLVNSNGGFYNVGTISSTQNFQTITIPSNIITGYYDLQIYNPYATADISSNVTIYINGTTNGTPTGSPITSQYYLATTTLYNATSTCAGNYIQLSSDVYGYDSYRWTKDGIYLTSTSTSNYLNATTTGAYTLKMMKCGTEYTSPNTINLRFYDFSPPLLTATSNGVSSTTTLNICDGASTVLSTNCPLWSYNIWDNATSTTNRTVYANASSSPTYTVQCGNYFCTSPVSQSVRVVNYPYIQSTKSGNWQDPTMWTNNFVPLNCQTVTIQTGHTVNVPINDAKAKNIIIRGNLNFQNVSPTVKGKVGLGI